MALVAPGKAAPAARGAGSDSAGIILHINGMPKPHRPARRPLSRRDVLKSLALGAAAAAGLETRRSRGAESGQKTRCP